MKRTINVRNGSLSSLFYFSFNIQPAIWYPFLSTNQRQPIHKVTFSLCVFKVRLQGADFAKMLTEKFIFSGRNTFSGHFLWIRVKSKKKSRRRIVPFTQVCASEWFFCAKLKGFEGLEGLDFTSKRFCKNSRCLICRMA